MIINQTNYLDFGSILVFEVIGGIVLAIFIGWVILALVSIKYRIPFNASFSIGILWAGAMISLAYNPLIWALLLLVVAVIGYGTYAKIIKR